MKNLPAILVLLAVGIGYVFSQSSSDEVISNPFALTYGVDTRLSLVTPDTGAQILFNPARAIKYNRQFIAGKYDADPVYYTRVYSPVYYELDNNYRVAFDYANSTRSSLYVSQSTPSVDIALLQKAGDSFWLLQITNLTDIYSSENSTSSNILTSGSNRNRFRETQSYSDNDVSKTKIRLSRVVSFEDFAFSYGLFGKYIPDSRENSSLSTTSDTYASTGSSYIRNENSRYSSMMEQPKYSLGAEVSMADDQADALLTVEMTLGEMKQRSSQGDDDISMDSSGSYKYRRVYKRNSSFTSVSDPVALLVNGYYGRRTSIMDLPLDMFVSFHTGYTIGDFDLTSEYSYIYRYQYDTTVAGGDTLIVDAAGSVERNDYTASIFTGALTTIDLDELKIQTGLVGEFYYGENVVGQVGYNYDSEFMLLKYNYTRYGAEFLIPVMITYDPAEWCTIFSGLNIRTSLSREETKYASLPFNKHFRTFYSSNINANQSLHQSGFMKNVYYTSYNTAFVNIQLQHRSGFKLQFAFKNDFTRFREWGISAMYFF